MNPVCESLVDAYRRIADERMAGIPFANESLTVDGVGFRDVEGRNVGVLITPWCMNLVVLETQPEDSGEGDDEEKRTFRFPAGEFEFVNARIDEVPAHHALALFTSVEDFPDMATARAVAAEILRRILEPDADDAPAERSQAGEDALAAKPVSRRTLLRRTLLQDE
jgi:[NiFe] hydrogenase assembly HybE family chaperone